MPKVCQCKKQFIRDLFISTIKDAEESADDMYIYPIDEVVYSTSKTEEVSKILESDCVCEKKEGSHDRHRPFGTHVGNGLVELNQGYFAPIKEKQGRPIKDLITWAKMHSDEKYMRVGMTVFSDKSFVSTIWLGRDHNFIGEGAPIIFESMYFPKERLENEWQERYCTEEEAEKGHKSMVKRVLQEFPELKIVRQSQ